MNLLGPKLFHNYYKKDTEKFDLIFSNFLTSVYKKNTELAISNSQNVTLFILSGKSYTYQFKEEKESIQNLYFENSWVIYEQIIARNTDESFFIKFTERSVVLEIDSNILNNIRLKNFIINEFFLDIISNCIVKQFDMISTLKLTPNKRKLKIIRDYKPLFLMFSKKIIANHLSISKEILSRY